MAECFTISSDGLLFAVNGVDRPLRWDGVSDEFVLAGVDYPGTALTMTASGTGGGITGTYIAYYRFVDDRGNVSNLSPVATSILASDAAGIIYTNVGTSDDAKVVRRQILRNTAGQATTMYVDIDTEDMTSSSFTSTRKDSELSTQESVPLFDADGNDLVNLFFPPPDHKPAAACHQDRMFLAGEGIYSHGCVKVTLGSKTVYGYGTEWPINFSGRFLWVSGADKEYEIDEVDADTQTITLLEPYGANSSPYSTYAIRPPIAERKLVYFSEAGLPEAWPAINSMSVQEDNDDVIGLMPKGSWLFILEKRHIYRLTYQVHPQEDGHIFQAVNRGCVNNRCWVVIDETGYLMDEAGVYSLEGGGGLQDLSAPIQDLFKTSITKTPKYKIQWEASKWFHACYDPGQRVVRWFVTLSGKGYPRHALCFELAQKRWWIEEYPVPISSSVNAIYAGENRTFVGGPSGKVLLLGGKLMDGVDYKAGTVRGTVGSVTPLSLTDLTADFNADVVGSTVRIISGRGKGQYRKIVAATAYRLTLDRPWVVWPNSESQYQIGGIHYRWRTSWFPYAMSENEHPRRLELQFEPLNREATMDARVYVDRSRTPVVWDYTYSSSDANGFASTAGETDLTADLTKEIGFVQRRVDGQKEFMIDGPRMASWELEGTTNGEGVIVYQVKIDGMVGQQ